MAVDAADAGRDSAPLSAPAGHASADTGSGEDAGPRSACEADDTSAAAADGRAARLGAALRANLQRRKARARALAEGEAEAPAEEPREKPAED